MTDNFDNSNLNLINKLLKPLSS